MSIYVDIHKKLDSFELNVQFEAENETLALFGESGCGKSMTLRCIAGIEKPDSGRIVLNGKVLFDSEKRINLSPQKRNVGYLFQQYAMFPNMTVIKNIECGAKGAKNPEKAAALIKAMHLEGLENKYPSQISGGQQQRTALARILIGNPDILMLDEPFSALDAHLKSQMEAEVKSVINRFGKPVILVSHDNQEVYRLSDTIAIMKDGKIETSGPKKEIYLNPGTTNGALLTGYRNISRATAIGNGMVHAHDWGADIHVSGNLEGVTHVAARTDSIILVGNKNKIQCIVKDIAANAFSSAIMVSPKYGNEDITFVIHTKEVPEGVAAGSEISVTIPQKDLIPLRG